MVQKLLLNRLASNLDRLSRVPLFDRGTPYSLGSPVVYALNSLVILKKQPHSKILATLLPLRTTQRVIPLFRRMLALSLTLLVIMSWLKTQSQVRIFNLTCCIYKPKTAKYEVSFYVELEINSSVSCGSSLKQV